jgi:transposase
MLGGLVSKTTVNRWIKHYQTYYQIPAETRNDLLKHRRRLYKKITNNIKEILLGIVTEMPHLYLDEVQDYLHQGSFILVHQSSISRCLRREIGWSLQVAVYCTRQRDELERQMHMSIMYNITNDPSMFIFVDKTAKEKLSSRRRKRWRKRGLRYNNDDISLYFHNGHTTLYTLIAAADINGFVPEACELIRRARTNPSDCDAGTIDSDRFVEYIRDSLVPTLGNFFNGERRSIVVMDNASTHNSEEIHNLITQAGAILILQPTHSPDLNPIEFCFHQYKSHLKRHNFLYGRRPLIAHWKALGSVSSYNMRNIYRHIGFFNNLPNEVENNNEEAVILIVVVTIFLTAINNMILLINQ